MKNFLIETLELETHYWRFNVEEVVSWDLEDNPIETEQYLKGMIKWDGCSHINFGDNAGYLHLCGGTHWKYHSQLMERLFREAEKKIEAFDISELEDYEEGTCEIP